MNNLIGGEQNDLSRHDNNDVASYTLDVHSTYPEFSNSLEFSNWNNPSNEAYVSAVGKLSLSEIRAIDAIAELLNRIKVNNDPSSSIIEASVALLWQTDYREYFELSQSRFDSTVIVYAPGFKLVRWLEFLCTPKFCEQVLTPCHAEFLERYYRFLQKNDKTSAQLTKWSMRGYLIWYAGKGFLTAVLGLIAAFLAKTIK